MKMKSELCTNSRSRVVMTHISLIIIFQPHYISHTPASNLTRITQPHFFSTPTTAFPKQTKKKNSLVIISSYLTRQTQKCHHTITLSNTWLSFFSSWSLPPQRQPEAAEESSVLTCQVAVHHWPEPPQGPLALAMVQTGTTAADGAPDPAPGTGMVPVRAGLQRALP